MIATGKIKYIVALSLVLLFGRIIGQSNPANITLSTNQSVPVDETKRATSSIKLQEGFKYGSGSNGSRLTLQISSYPSYVENGYQEFGVNCAHNDLNLPLVGELEGNFSVSLIGSAIYEVPIKMSSGTAGIQPKLKLVYTSGSGSNIMGSGWNLSGLSVISRVNKIPYADGKYDCIKFDATDVFALDGNRLLLKNGTYGASNSVYSTELETFSEITALNQQNNSPQYFVVTDKNGITTEYGNSVDSKLVGVGDNMPLSWFISKVSDVYGNYMTYHYKQLSGEVVIERIEYTKNNSAGLIPMSEITFEYMPKTEKNTLYVGGKEFKTTQLLKSITAKHNGELVKKYVLEYEYNFQSVLSKITEVNQDGSQLSATDFCYSDPAENTIGQYASISSYNTPLYPSNSPNYAQIKSVIPADINGDGFSDVVVIKKTNQYEVLINDYLNASQTNQLSFTSLGDKPSPVIPLDSILGSFTLDANFDNFQEVYNILGYANHKSYQIVKVENTGVYGSPVISVSTVPNTSRTLNNSYDPTEKPSKFYYDINDYNGDGNNDELIIDPELIQINSSLGNKTYPVSTLKTLARPIDFDGDGYLEVIVFKDLTTSLGIDVLKYIPNNSTLSVIYSTSIPFTSNSNQNLLKLITIGDFNGDGKGDVMYLNETKQNLNIKYSNGLAYTLPKAVTNFQPLTQTTNYTLSSPDINGDGINDVIFIEDKNAGQLENYIAYYSVGDFFIKGPTTQGKFDDVFMSCKYYYYTDKGEYRTFSKIQKQHVYEYSVDFNGDGIFDVFSYDGSQSSALLNNVLSSKSVFLKTITTPLHNRIDITYANTKTQLDNQHILVYDRNHTSYNSDFLAYTPGGYVVSYVQYGNYADMVNLSQSERYFYGGAIFHKYGKGFLGFENTTKLNLGTLLGENSSVVFNQTYHIPSKTTIKKGKFTLMNLGGNVYSYYMTTGGNFTGVASKVETDFQITQTSNGSLFVAPSHIDSKDFLSSTASTTDLTYNLSLQGNPTSKITNYGWTGQTPAVIKTEASNFTYQNIGSIPYNSVGIIKPQTETNTSTQNGEPAVTRTSEYVYDGQKHLSAVIQDPNLPNHTLTTTFSNFNIFGSPKLTTTTASDIQTRTVENEFDATGRFITKTTNTRGDFEEFVYDPKYGSLLQKKDISGLISKFSYDGLGRLIKSQLPDNTTNTVAYEYSNVIDVVYSKTVKNEGSPDVITFYDNFGNVVRNRTTDVNGKTIVVENKYNYSTGFLEQSSEPYYEQASDQPTYLVTIYSYEPIYKRLVKEELGTKNASNPALVPTLLNLYTEYKYNQPSRDFLNGNYDFQAGFTEKTDHTNKRIIKYNNAAGQLVETRNYEGYENVSFPQVPVLVTDYQKSVYEYHSNGNPKQVVVSSTYDPNPITHTFEYDELGRQSKLIDPSAGTTTYTYSTIGELLKQTDALSTTEFTYDNVGRLDTKTNTQSGTTTYEYVTANAGKNKLKKITGQNVTTEYTYDNLGRTLNFKETLNDNTPQVFTSSAQYNKYGDVTEYTYPSGFKTKYQYTQGVLTQITDDNNNLIWKQNNSNAVGNITEYEYGNGINTQVSYTNLHHLQSIEHGSLFKQDYVFNTVTGNLTKRTMQNFATGAYNREVFSFDALDRLRQNQQVDPNAFDTPIYTNNIDIDDKGNITHKDDAGDYIYGNTSQPFTLTQINNPTPNIPTNPIIATYNGLRKVSQLSEATTNKLMKFTYGNDDERIKVEYELNGINQYTRYYQTDYEKETAQNSTKEWTYIYAPTGLCAVYYTNNSANQLHYVMTDHLGSPLLLTDQSQNITEELSFDSWGRRRNPADWTYTNIPTPNILHRGYTTHEHIDEFNLINMNGRVYDPVLGRFIQPDNFVQEPDNLQNFNRYAYCLNNPLTYTDPSGQFYGMALYAMGFVVLSVDHLIEGGYSNPFQAAWREVGEEFNYASSNLRVSSHWGNTSWSLGVDMFAMGVSMNIEKQTGNWNYGITLGYGISGGYASAYVGYTEGDFHIGTGVGTFKNGYSYGGSISYKGYGLSYYQTSYGGEKGPDGNPNPQTTGSVGIFGPNWSFRMENDFAANFFKGSGDKWRTGAFEITVNKLSVGFNIYTNKQKADYPVDDEGRSLIWGCNRPDKEGNILGAWTNGKVYSSPIWVGYDFGYGVSRVGFSNKYVQDFAQNGIHKWVPFGRQNYYNNYDEFNRGAYFYNGYYNPYSLYGR